MWGTLLLCYYGSCLFVYRLHIFFESSNPRNIHDIQFILKPLVPCTIWLYCTLKHITTCSRPVCIWWQSCSSSKMQESKKTNSSLYCLVRVIVYIHLSNNWFHTCPCQDRVQRDQDLWWLNIQGRIICTETHKYTKRHTDWTQPSNLWDISPFFRL